MGLEIAFLNGGGSIGAEIEAYEWRQLAETAEGPDLYVRIVPWGIGRGLGEIHGRRELQCPCVWVSVVGLPHIQILIT